MVKVFPEVIPSGPGGALPAGPRASMVRIRLGQLEMLPLAQRRHGLTGPASAAQNRLPCIKQIPQLRSPCASLYYFPTKMRNGNSAPFHPPTGNRPPLSLGMLGAAAVIPLLQMFLNISIVTPRSLSPASWTIQSNTRYNDAFRAPISYRYIENIVVMLGEHHINSGNPCCSEISL